MEGEVVFINAGLPTTDVHVAHLAVRGRVAEVTVEDVLTSPGCLTLLLVYWNGREGVDE